MAVKIRLFRVGKKKNPMYRIVVTDSRKGSRGKYIEKIGFYNPTTEPIDLSIDKEKALEWMRKGAKPSNTVLNLFRETGIALEYHLERNNADEKTRQIEIQKWELAKKEADSKKRAAAEEELKKEAAEEAEKNEAEEKKAEKPAEKPAEDEEKIDESKEEKTEE